MKNKKRVALAVIAGMCVAGLAIYAFVKRSQVATLTRTVAQLSATGIAERRKFSKKLGRAQVMLAESRKSFLSLKDSIGVEETPDESVRVVGRLVTEKTPIEAKGEAVKAEIIDDRTVVEFKGPDFEATLDAGALSAPAVRVLADSSLGVVLDIKIGAILTIGTAHGVDEYRVDVHTVGDDGKRVRDLKLESFSIVETTSDAKGFHFFNPRIGYSVGYDWRPQDGFASTFGADISIASYGETRDDLTWRFVKLGGSYSFEDDKGRFDACPAAYNLADHIPLLTNLWFGSCYSLRSDGSHGIQINLGGLL